MKINKRQLIRLIKEAMDDAQIRQYGTKINKLDIGDFLRQLGFRGTVGRFAEDALKFAGFKYVKEEPGPEFDYSDLGPTFRFQAKHLGCQVNDLAFVTNNDPGDPGIEGEETQSETIFKQINGMINSMSAKNAVVSFPLAIDEEDDDESEVEGEHTLYELAGLKVLLSVYYNNMTATICGK